MPAGRYDDAFTAAIEALEERRLPVDRVDARAGVITSAAIDSPGLAGAGDGTQTTTRNLIQDTAHRHVRTVRIEFTTPERDEATAPEPPRSSIAASPAMLDLRDQEGPLVARVVVTVERVAYPGRRLETESVRGSSVSRDVVLQSRGVGGITRIPIRRDSALEQRLAERVRRELQTVE